MVKKGESISELLKQSGAKNEKGGWDSAKAMIFEGWGLLGLSTASKTLE